MNNSKDNPHLEIVRLVDGAEPVLVGTCAVPVAISLALAGKYLYLPESGNNMDAGLTIVDISNPEKPVIAAKVAGSLMCAVIWLRLMEKNFLCPTPCAGLSAWI